MATEKRKRKEHVPPTCTQVKLPKSRCSGKKFITVIARLAPEKQQAIREMGFGGLLTFACRELRYELCGWLISQYDFTYHRLNMETGNAITVNEEHVNKVMGIPNSGVDVVILKRTTPSNRTYTLRVLEQNLEHLPVCDEFLKSFLIFSCATLLAPNSKLEGSHDLWDTIWDGDVGVQRNWAKFLLKHLEDGIKEYRQKQPTYIRGCLMFLQLFYMAYFYMPSVNVEVTSPLAAAWTDDVMKRRLAAEISTFDGYGYVRAQERAQSTTNMDVPSVASTSTADDDATEVIKARVIDTSESMVRLASSLVRDVAALCKQTSADEMEPQDNLAPTPHSPIGMEPSPEATHSEPMAPQSHAEASLPPQVTIEEARECDRVGGSGDQAIKPSSIKRFKRTCKRIVKRPPTCKSPFVTQCVKQFPKIPHAHRVVADYAWQKLAILGRWVNSVIVAIVSRMMNGQQAPPARTHYFDPSFSVILTNLKTNATSQVIMDRCRMYLDAGILGHDLGTCDMMFIPVCENNHWHMHVVNFAVARVEILSSLPLRRGNSISAATRRLSMAINKALHAYAIHMDVDVSTFEHVQPHLVQQLNGFDCGILALKFMEFWNGAT
ncbi:Ubiquitin-like-specific protease 1A [Vitis vinifera]|uniref:Ubiquitin-like-specific protease 1A n=1 Tax=Vitis vinifera TaxID=29760 RepID=A0A438GS29_VITVI|nr:Ubiquitin-like-specific protease 1A [Vitis vinifera]